MIHGEDVEAIAASSYHAGMPPLSFAEILTTEILIQAAAGAGITATRRQAVILARQILAALLDAGWQAP